MAHHCGQPSCACRVSTSLPGLHPSAVNSNFFVLFCFLFIFGYAERRLLLGRFSSCRGWGSLSSPGVRASHRRDSSRLRAQAPELQLAGSRAQTQKFWRTTLVAPWPVGFSRTRDRTRVSCTGRQILYHSATREVRSSALQSRHQKVS